MLKKGKNKRVKRRVCSVHASFQLFTLITPLPSQASSCQAFCPTSQAVLWWTKPHKPKWPLPTGLHQQLFSMSWFKGELRASATPTKPHHLHQFLVPDSPMASAHTLGPHRLFRVPGMAGSTKESLGLACAPELSSLQPEPKDTGPLTPVPAAHKEQDIPAPLGLLSGARQSPEALAKGGSKSPSASTAHPSPQQLQLKAPVLGELLESTPHHLKANMTRL